MKYKILLFSTSAGAGHMRAAEAVKTAFDESGLEGTARVIDVLDFMTAPFRKLYISGYYTIIARAPWYWSYMYKSWDKRKSNGIQRRAICLLDRINSTRLKKFIADEQPTHIICSHFLPAELFAFMRRTGKLSTPLGVVITDYDAHNIWINEGTDRYFIATDSLRDLLASKGPAPEIIGVTGIPIDSAFSRPLDRAAIRAEFGLSSDVPTVLVTGGGGGIGGVDTSVDELSAISPLQIFAVAGKNEKLLTQLRAKEMPEGVRLVPFGYVNIMPKLMAASDLMITKPGGLSTSEALATGLPLVLTVPIPGQEEKNIEYLTAHNAAVAVTQPGEIRTSVFEILRDDARLARMKASALAIAHPTAARAVLDEMLRLK